MWLVLQMFGPQTKVVDTKTADLKMALDKKSGDRQRPSGFIPLAPYSMKERSSLVKAEDVNLIVERDKKK